MIETTITQAPSQNAKSGGGGLSGGATAGIVIVVLLIIGGAAGAFFYMRRRRKEAYQKYEGSNFDSSPGSLNRPFGVDQRLEPGMVQKRESVGSLADEQDYSRKILRVLHTTFLLLLIVR
jgi:cell wall integrity and stress response component